MARRRSEINHYSGISVRMSIHNMENLVSNAFRRALRLNEKEVAPRINDLTHLTSSMKGKIEWDFVEDNAEDEKIKILIRDAVSKTFRHYFSQDSFANFLKEFSEGDGIKVTEMTPSHTYLKSSEAYPSLKERIAQLTDATSTTTRASAVEFILEGLAIAGKIKKEVNENGLIYNTKQ
jgi:magnesium chelatase subunit I